MKSESMQCYMLDVENEYNSRCILKKLITRYFFSITSIGHSTEIAVVWFIFNKYDEKTKLEKLR